MKVNYNFVEGKPINSLIVGETFFARRSSDKYSEALYMKVDANSGIIAKVPNSCYAVNLESGQVRKFHNQDLVNPIDTEVNIIKRNGK